MSSNPFEIAIIGGGIAGLTLAIALHSRDVPVTVYEQARHFGEIGAGVSFTPNAVQAMKICHPGVFEAFEKVCTRNQYPSKQKTWFDFYDGYEEKRKPFTIYADYGQNGVHRARFLDELIKLVPSSICRFGKHLDTISEQADGKLQMKFADGSTAEADAVIGCDGIKSKVRQLIVGEDHPSAHPQYTYKYAYRGLVPMEKAIEAVGDEKARNACMHLGPNGHILTFNVEQGQTMNIVAFRTAPGQDWPDHNKLTKPAHREQALEDFEGWGRDVTELLKLTKPELDIWAIFDTGAHPVPTFTSGRLLVTGDAAHATSPHHGAGAGLCIEDSAVLASLLSHPEYFSLPSTRNKNLETAFAIFDARRRDRGHGLVQSSRIVGDTYDWVNDEVGDDFAKIEQVIASRNAVIHHVDVAKMCADAREELERRLSSS